MTTMDNWGISEQDQILIPDTGGVKFFPLMLLFGFSSRMLRSYTNFGHAPLHFITQRGPQQDGATPIDMRYDPRTVQIVVAEGLCNRTTFWDRRNEILDLLRPNRSFTATAVTQSVYRKWLPGGKLERGTDMTTTNGSPTVTSHDARFIHYGGLRGGERLTIGGVNYTIADVPNDFTAVLTINYAAATDTNVAWSYVRDGATRDLFFLLEQGPTFAEGPGPSPFVPTGYREVLRLIAYDPFWHGVVQSQTWALPTDFGDLVFDGEGAWMGDVEGVGRWLFSPTAIGEPIDVVYWGTFRARPDITITGPASDPSVLNLTTGKSILVSADLLAGESMTISVQAQTVTKNDGTNLLPFTVGDLATFGLEPPPQAPNRVNVIQVAFSGATGDSGAVMTWENLYVGI